MRYCVRVKNDGALGDVLIALAKLLHQDEIEDGEEDTSVSPPIPVQPASTKEEQEWEEIYLERAKNMSVVVMREGYIAKMAPVCLDSLTERLCDRRLSLYLTPSSTGFFPRAIGCYKTSRTKSLERFLFCMSMN